MQWAPVSGLLAAICLTGCGLAGLDASGRPDPCPGPAQPVEQPPGVVTCAVTPAKVILTGDLPPNAPSVRTRIRDAAELIGDPVAYSDGKTTVTYFPGEGALVGQSNQ